MTFDVYELPSSRYALYDSQDHVVVVVVVPLVITAGSVLMLQHKIIVDQGFSDHAEFQAVLDRVAPHIQGGWTPYCRPESWVGTIYGDASNASTAIKALGDLYLCDDEGGEPFQDEYDADEALMARTLNSLRNDLRRAAHEGMHLQSLGQIVSDPTTRWALEHAEAL